MDVRVDSDKTDGQLEPAGTVLRSHGSVLDDRTPALTVNGRGLGPCGIVTGVGGGELRHEAEQRRVRQPGTRAGHRESDSGPLLGHLNAAPAVITQVLHRRLQQRRDGAVQRHPRLHLDLVLGADHLNGTMVAMCPDQRERPVEQLAQVDARPREAGPCDSGPQVARDRLDGPQPLYGRVHRARQPGIAGGVDEGGGRADGVGQPLKRVHQSLAQNPDALCLLRPEAVLDLRGC